MPVPMNPLLRAARAGGRPALFLDYDGTLVPLGPDPRRARLTAARREILRRLAERVPVAVVSGRSLDDLRGMIGLPGLVLAGNHGLEIGAGEARWVHPRAARARFALEALLGEIRPALAAIPRVLIEDKGLTLSIHYRLSRPGAGAKIGRLLRRLLAGRKKDLVLNTGKDVYEIGPRAAWNKGKAALRILQTAFPPGSLPVYIGDDTTDEDAFRVLAPIGLTARVGGGRRTAAQYRLESIDSVWSFLRGLLVPTIAEDDQKAFPPAHRGGRKKNEAAARPRLRRI